MRNQFVSHARSTWYGLTEPVKLAWSRKPCLQVDPLVSIYVPTFNRRELLIERCLKSILAQTYKNFEVIVVAHGCTDGTVVAVLSLRDQRIKVVSIPREKTYPTTLENHWFAGRVAASNVGLENCRGGWITSCDDDDSWRPELIEHLLRFAQHGNYEFVSAAGQNQNGPIEPYDVDGVKVGPLQTWLYRSYLSSFRFNKYCYLKSWNKVCDVDLQDRFRKAGVRMGFLDEVLCDIIPRPGDTVVGLAAARENKNAYMKHLAFK